MAGQVVGQRQLLWRYAALVLPGGEGSVAADVLTRAASPRRRRHRMRPGRISRHRDQRHDAEFRLEEMVDAGDAVWDNGSQEEQLNGVFRVPPHPDRGEPHGRDAGVDR
jgi:hypothetical protein